MSVSASETKAMHRCSIGVRAGSVNTSDSERMARQKVASKFNRSFEMSSQLRFGFLHLILLLFVTYCVFIAMVNQLLMALNSLRCAGVPLLTHSRQTD